MAAAFLHTSHRSGGGPYSFAEHVSRTPGFTAGERAAAFSALPGELQRQAHEHLRICVEERERAVRAEVVGQ